MIDIYFTILCPSGIVLAADSAATIRNPISNEVEKIITTVKKIYGVSKTNFGISCWGLGTIQGSSIVSHLAEFEELFIKKTDTIDDVAEKLVIFLQENLSENTNQMGLHLAGYMLKEDKNVPQIRHVFHEKWHNPGEFVNENIHMETLQETGRFRFPSYRTYPPLFNRDNAIANCLVNYIPNATNGTQRIEPVSLNLEECIELAELVVGVSIQRLNYYVDSSYKRIPKTVGGEVSITKITASNGFEWVKK